MFLSLRLSLAFCSFSLLFGQIPPAFVGRVLDQGGRAVAANVECRTVSSAFSVAGSVDDNGRYSCIGLPSDEYLVTVLPRVEGFASVTVGPLQYEFPYTNSIDVVLPVKISPGNALLVTAGSSQQVRVWGDFDLGDVKPITVCFTGSDGKRCVETNQFGQYYLDRLSIGRYTVSLLIDGAAILEREIVVPAGVFYYEPIAPQDVKTR